MTVWILFATTHERTEDLIGVYADFDVMENVSKV